MASACRSALAWAALGVLAALACLWWRQLALLEAAARCQETGATPVPTAQILALREAHGLLQASLQQAQEENERLRLEAAQLERLCIPEEAPVPRAGGGSGPVAAAAGGSVEPACEPRTLHLAPGEPVSEMTFVRQYLLTVLGWREVADPEQAAFVLAAGDAPPVKRPCQPDFVGMRIPGAFGRELEVCQKHKLSARLATYWSGGAASRQPPGGPSPDDVSRTWPWLPRTYLLSSGSHSAALNASLPCDGAQSDYIVKGDAHGGRAVWLPPSYEELRALVGLPCPGAPRPLPGSGPEHPPRLVQEVVRSLLWDGASIMGRVFMLALRRGRTRFSAEHGRWSLGWPAPAYELHVFDTPLFTQYPGRVRDSASEEEVRRRNASELDAFVRAALGRRGMAADPLGWVASHFMKEAGNIAAQAFLASSTPWASDAAGADATDAVKAAALEPDGAFLFVAQELLIDADFQVRLIEFTCVPADIHGLQAQFEALPWTKAFAEDLGEQLALMLLRASGQDVGELRGASTAGRWTKVAERGPFPHP